MHKRAIGQAAAQSGWAVIAMRPPLPNLLITLLGAFLTFVGLTVHPSVIVLAVGFVLSLI